MRRALPGSEYYCGSAPPGLFGRHRTYPHRPLWVRGKWGAKSGRFPRSLVSGRWVRYPAMPLRSRHGYAVAIHRGLPAQTPNARSGVPHLPNETGGCAPRTSPYPPGLSWRPLKRRNDTGSSRIPSHLAHRARPIRQCQVDPTSSRLLSPFPAIPGSGCLLLHQAATTARSWTVSHLHPDKNNQRLVAHWGWGHARERWAESSFMAVSTGSVLRSCSERTGTRTTSNRSSAPTSLTH